MRTRPLFALLAAGAVVLTACGSDNSSTSSGATAAPATTAAASAATTAAASAATTASDAYGGGYAVPATTAAAAASGGTAVNLADNKLGKIVVDTSGNTLYAFMKDTGGTPTCSGACADAWPAAIATGTPTAGAGITATLTAIDRPDGKKQLKLGDWPLYRFAGDIAAGDANGQGSGNMWYVVGADGAPVK